MPLIVFSLMIPLGWLRAEVFFALGCKAALHEEVQRRAMQMRAQAGVASTGGGLKSA